MTELSNEQILRVLAQNRLRELVDQAAKVESYNKIVQYLQSQNRMPRMEVTFERGAMPSGTFAQFERDPLENTGIVKLSPYATPASLIHELTHAAMSALQSQQFNYQRARQKNLFTEAYQKLMEDKTKKKTSEESFPQKQFARRLDPKWYETESAKRGGYRVSAEELPAFGVGNVAFEKDGNRYKGGSHVDPSMATEFLTILDLAQRASKGEFDKK